jgi:uncharacterized Zn ribbon protein
MPFGAVGTWSADEVADWLRTQGLSESVVKELTGAGMSGSDLVLLTAEEMKGAGVRPLKAGTLVKKIQALAT